MGTLLIEVHSKVNPNYVKMCEEGEEVKLQGKVWAPPFDARFPNQNQTRNCWQNYVDFIDVRKSREKSTLLASTSRRFTQTFVLDTGQRPGMTGATVEPSRARSKFGT